MDNIYTPEEWNKCSKMFRDLEKFAEEYISNFISSESFASIDITADIFTIHTEEYFSGCGTDYNEYEIPLAWLSEPDIMKRCEQQRQDQKIAAEQAELNRQAERKEDARKSRHKQFLKLQNEFEGENN